MICRPSLSQLVPYLSLRCHVCFNLTKGRGGGRSILGITGTSNLISVIYCVQKPDTGWQRDIDKRRLMSEEITVRRIFSPLPLSSIWISSDSPPLHVKGMPQLTWDEYSSLMIHCCFVGWIYFASLLHEKRNRCMCISTLQMQMQFFWVSKCISTFYKKHTNPWCPIWKKTVDSGISDRPGTNMHFNNIFPTVICAEYWLWPHSDECPGLPCWDVPPNQTPASHHAPVTVAAYSSAHHPQGPGQGGLLSHINISFHTAARHSWIETCTS